MQCRGVCCWRAAVFEVQSVGQCRGDRGCDRHRCRGWGEGYCRSVLTCGVWRGCTGVHRGRGEGSVRDVRRRSWGYGTLQGVSFGHWKWFTRARDQALVYCTKWGLVL